MRQTIVIICHYLLYFSLGVCVCVFDAVVVAVVLLHQSAQKYHQSLVFRSVIILNGLVSIVIVAVIFLDRK